MRPAPLLKSWVTSDAESAFFQKPTEEIEALENSADDLAPISKDNDPWLAAFGLLAPELEAESLTRTEETLLDAT